MNTFVKDSMDPNPLIRALAVRTMGCIRVDKITEYICDPLQHALRDDDPYVRKTAAMCVAKLHDISPTLVEDRGFIDDLNDMVLKGSGNPMVVANAVAALAEMQEVSGTPYLTRLGPTATTRLLATVEECSEWGQVYILDALYHLVPNSSKDCVALCDRVVPRLQHANSAVVLSAVRLIVACLSRMSTDQVPERAKKLAAPLISLISAQPEIQYVALRNIQVILEQFPTLLMNEVRVFFCKYNDPLYVKMEKLDVLMALVTPDNVLQILMELKEYANEVDVEFARKVIRGIGFCAMKDTLSSSTDRCMGVLVELVKGRIPHVVQESVVVIKDVLRKFPNQYESVVTSLASEAVDHLDDDPEAKAAMIWIVGEYADRIDNATETLGNFLESFPEEDPVVQLQLLTAAVKLFLLLPTTESQRLIQLVLSSATTDTDNLDLRDRAYMYWRLLSSDPELAKNVVLGAKPPISTQTVPMVAPLRKELLRSLSTVAAVYHRPASTFVSGQRAKVQRLADLQAARAKDDEGVDMDDDDILGLGAGTSSTATNARANGGGIPGGSRERSATDELFELDVGAAATTRAPDVNTTADDLLGLSMDAGSVPMTVGGVTTTTHDRGADDLDFLGLGSGSTSAKQGGLSTSTTTWTSTSNQASLTTTSLGPESRRPAGILGSASASPQGLDLDLLGGPSASAATAAAKDLPGSLPIIVPGAKGKGVEVRGALHPTGGPSDAGVTLRLSIENLSSESLSQVLVQVNKNAVGLTAPTGGVVPLRPATCLPGTHATAELILPFNPAQRVTTTSKAGLELALKVGGLGVVYATVPYTAACLGTPVATPAATFIQQYSALPAGMPSGGGGGFMVVPCRRPTVEFVRAQLPRAGVAVVHERAGAAGETCIFGSAQSRSGGLVLVDLRVGTGGSGLRVLVKGQEPGDGGVVLGSLLQTLV